MAKFNTILVKKIAADRKQESKQEKIKEEVGISDQDVFLKKRSAKDYAIAFLHCILYMVFIALIFIGLITALNPASRQIIVDWFI